MIPTQDTTHVAEAVALLTSMFANKAVIKGLVSATATEVQTLENAVWSYLNGVQISNHPMGGGPWDVLDKIGKIVGINRNSLTDVDFLAAIKIKVRVNRSQGLAEDIIQIAALIVNGATYTENYPASFEVDAWNLTNGVALALVSYLGEAKSASTLGLLRYSLVPLTSVIILGSTTGSVPTAKGFKDSVGGGFPNTLSSLQALIHP